MTKNDKILVSYFKSRAPFKKVALYFCSSRAISTEIALRFHVK